eukprot:scaffold29934_cov103-Isochrysis_galbana.AAC.5
MRRWKLRCGTLRKCTSPGPAPPQVFPRGGGDSNSSVRYVAITRRGHAPCWPFRITIDNV